MTRVKKLEWREVEVPKANAWAASPTTGISYWITSYRSEEYVLEGRCFPTLSYPTLEAAKGAAEADYEARILACLEPPTVAEAARVLLNSKTVKALEADGRQVDFSAFLRALAGEGKP